MNPSSPSTSTSQTHSALSPVDPNSNTSFLPSHPQPLPQAPALASPKFGNEESFLFPTVSGGGDVTMESLGVGGGHEAGFGGGGGDDDAVHFCLLAEFDIDSGSTLAHQYPYPIGMDEFRLAELMLPEGAHHHGTDWTIFYLGQSPLCSVAPMLSFENSSSPEVKRASMIPFGSRPRKGVPGGGLLYCLNCVRMKEDKTVRRGAMVKAMALCSPNPYIWIYKPVLLLALEEYFNNPSAEIVARLFDTTNAVSLAGMPSFTRSEKLFLRSTDRKDVFEERFILPPEGGLEEGQEVFEEPSETGHSDGGRFPSSVGRHGGETSSISRSRFTPDQGSTESTTKKKAKEKQMPKDTHYFETDAQFGKMTLPIRVPLANMDEEVGEYSLIELVQTFSNNPPPFQPPFHPHLHTNGAHTHPIILILNAMLANKRVVFVGEKLAANQVGRIVLSACALATGCGQVLRGVTETAFPYASLSTLDVLETFPGYIAGVTNPQFKKIEKYWDLYCDINTGEIIISKNITSGGTGYAMGSIKARTSETSLSNSIVRVDEDASGTPQAKMNSISKADCIDNQFMEEITAAIASHYGESYIRQRFTEYLQRFTLLTAYHEYQHTGSTKLGYPTLPFRDGVLGSGVVFPDDSVRQREMWANGQRIEAWRRTKTYQLFQKDCQKEMQNRSIKAFDLQHQISRLRLAKNITDHEAEAIFIALVENVRTYDQIIELLTFLPQHWGGLVPIANGMYHRWPGVRDNAVEMLLILQTIPAGRQMVQSMNYFHRKTLLTLLDKRESEQRLARYPSHNSNMSPELTYAGVRA